MSGTAGGFTSPNELSGFGFPEVPTASEVCRRDQCALNKPLATDLYCHDHGRFLPLITVPASIRVFTAVIFSLAIYGSFELAAQRNSELPLFVVYATISLGLVALPLRHFSRTAAITSLIWIIGSAIPIVSRVMSGRFNVLMAAAILGGGALIFATYAIVDVPHAKLPRSLDRGSQVISRIVAVAIIVAVWSTVVGLALRFENYVLPGNYSRTARDMLVVALLSLAVGVLGISASSIVMGVQRIKLGVRTIPRPNRPHWVAPKLLGIAARQYSARNVLDRTIEALAWAIYRIATSLANALIVIGRITANCAVMAAFALAYAIVVLTNSIVRLAVLTARWVQATIASIARLAFYAILIVYRCIFNTVASVIVPVCVLIGTPWLVMAAANDTRLYLVQGSLLALRDLFVAALGTVALLLGTWVILANQHPRESFKSFEQSGTITTAYGLIIVFTGGWLLGIPGQLGYGHIRVGPVTLSSTGLVVVALLYYLVRRRAVSNVSTQPPTYTPPAPGSGAGGQRWTVAVAFVLILGLGASLVIWKPWMNVSVSQPTRLTANSATSTSLVIGWSAPFWGPLPSRYAVIQDGSVVGYVSGASTSYDASGLAPDTSYTYQVIAVRNAHRSVASSIMRARTRTPRVWTAVIVGQWGVHYSNVTSTEFGGSAGWTTDAWTFTPDCTSNRCSVLLAGVLKGGRFAATLQRSSGVYRGTAKDTTFFSCGLSPITSDLTLTIRVLKGRVSGTQWVASSWTGTMTLSAPAGNCTAARISATISATQ
jgi:hypothetical protein